MKNHRLPLAAILALAFALRVWGIGFGLPDVAARPDESALVGLALGFLQGHFWPPFFDYPRLMPYVLAALFGVYALVGQAIGWFDSSAHFLATWREYWPPLFLIGRYVSATAGTLTVLVLYRFGSELFGRAVGLVTAFFLSVAFLHVRDSHYATTDALLTFLCWTALLWLVRAARSGDRRTLLVGTVISALALSTKYSAVPICLSLAVVLLLWRARGRATTGALLADTLRYAAVGAAVFLVLNPYVLFDHERFRHAMEMLSDSYSTGMPTAEPLGSGWVYQLTTSLRYGVGWPLLAAAAVGTLVAARRQGPALAVVAAFVVPYYALAGESRLLFVRYVMPLVPFVCLAAAVATAAVAPAVARFRPGLASGLTALLALAIATPTIASTVGFDRLLARRDSRSIAAAWVLSNVQPGASIAQSGSEYGRVGLGPRNQYRHWEYREAWGTWVDITGRRSSIRAGLPDYIIVNESPLPYSYVLPQMQADIDANYELLRVIRGQPASVNGSAYDMQDAFFLPYAGFSRIPRPGPTIYIWKRR